MSDVLSFFLFFLVFVPWVLIHLQNIRKSQKEMLDRMQETNRLLAEIANKNAG